MKRVHEYGIIKVGREKDSERERESESEGFESQTINSTNVIGLQLFLL